MEYIFVTSLLIILVGFSYFLNAKKASIPIIGLYVLFLIIELNSSNENNIYVSDKIAVDKPDIQQNIEQNNSESAIDGKKTEKNQENHLLSEGHVVSDETVIKKKSKEKVAKKVNEVILEKKEITKPKKQITEKNKKTEPEKKIEPEKALILKDIKICKGISNRKPIDVGTAFSNNVDSLYCYTKIENAGLKKEAKHIWYFENQIMTQVRYNVKKSKSYRSWTKKTILPYQVGNWRVDVQDQNGTIIGSKSFRIKK